MSVRMLELVSVVDQVPFSVYVYRYGIIHSYLLLSYDVASGSEITPCNKICKKLVVYQFMGNVITSITTLRT